MNENVLLLIKDELKKARKKHPKWPNDFVYGAAIVVEEAGEMMKEALNHYNITGGLAKFQIFQRLLQETVETAAMSIRFLENLLDDTQEGYDIAKDK